MDVSTSDEIPTPEQPDKPDADRLKPEKVAPDEPTLVRVRFDGSTDPTEPADVLEHDGHRLHRGREIEVPAEVANVLTSGENARLYRVARL